MKVVIVGAGNVATVLGRTIKNAGHDILQVISRSAANAKALASELNTTFADDFIALDKSADLYLVAVSDNALEQLGDQYQLGNKLVVHTAGSVSKEILKNVTHNYGVLYPLQSLRKQSSPLQQAIPLLIDANGPEALTLLQDFAKTLSVNVSEANDAARLKLHLAAVLVNNFTNHLYALAETYCAAEGVNFKLLQPLIEETALRTRLHSATTMQTGPAVRNDITTLEKHVHLLENYPDIKDVYLKMTDSIMNYE